MPRMSDRTDAAMQRITKWRVHFAGWQLGTRVKGDPECDAVSNHREATIMLRVEVTAITGLLLRKGIITVEELDRAIGDEADELEAAFEKRWPGARATEEGLTYDKRAVDWLQHWRK